MDLQAAHKNLADMVTQARAELHDYRDDNRGDKQFQHDLIDRFAQVSNGEPTTGLIHMALSLYWMAVQQDRITELTEAVEMREAGLQFLFELGDR